jgi:hypothetical protein
MFQVSTAAEQHEALVKTEVDYLPATAPFEHRYDDETQVGIVRGEAMVFFKVQDFNDRNQHRFFLEFEGRRLTDLGQTIEQVASRERKHVKFTLIEEITPGLLAVDPGVA